MSSEGEKGCFTFTWVIKNFTTFLSKGERNMTTPIFKVTTSNESVWKTLYLHNLADRIRFKRGEVEGSLMLDRFEVSLISSCGEEVLVLYSAPYDVQKTSILGENQKSVLPDDTLTVCCRIGGKSMETGNIRISTVLYKENFLWRTEMFNPYGVRSCKFFEIDGLLFKIALERNGETGNHTLEVMEVPNVDGRLSFIECQPFIGNNRGKVTRESGKYSNYTRYWSIDIFSKYNIQRNLEIQLDAMIAVHRKVGSPSSLNRPNYINPNKTVMSSGTLNEDLLHLYREALHTDATIQTEGKSFPVHKSILSARSPVFRAMFERDEMSEGRSGVVDIDDVDSETVDRMLVFLYGDSLENLQWEEASALYYAADKYEVIPLKNRCADILKAGLAVDNACDLLVLADKHSEEQLMKCVVDFILVHKEVLSLPQWEKLEDGNPRLTSKVMKEIILKK